MIEDLKFSARPDALSVLADVSHLIDRENVQAYIVGGFVRDILLKRDTADIDIAVRANALEIALKIAYALGGKYIPLDETNGIARVVLAAGSDNPDEGRWEIDFSTVEGSIEQNLAKRDFTIDALAIELGKIVDQPVSPESDLTLSRSLLIDPFKGWDDLQNGIIRAVTETAFQSDAARLLRAVRLAAELGFNIDSDTEALVKRHCQLVTSVAAERTKEELLRILAVPGSAQFLAYLDELGLLTAIIPELAQAKGVGQPWIHFWDVFDHSIQTVSAIEFLLRQGDWEYADRAVLTAVPWSTVLKQHFDREVGRSSTRGSLLKLAALLHDIAKPQTKAIDEEGRARFLGHPLEGATIAAAILERLRFSTKEIRLVELMVKHHLRPGQMSHEELPTPRAIYRYFRDTGEAGIDILYFSLADHLATRGPTLDMTNWHQHTKLVEHVLSRHLATGKPAAPAKLIDGHDLIRIFNMRPGPEIGQVLETVREAQAAGEVTDRDQALAYINHLLAHHREIPHE